MEIRNNKVQKLGSLVQGMTRITESETVNCYPQKKDPKYFRQIIYQVCPNFQVTEHNKKNLNSLFEYVHGNGDIDPKKGILFYGNVGTGKSTLMKILAEYQRLYGNGFKCVNCASLAAEFSTYGIDALNESTWNENHKGNNPVERGFDELGRETLPAKYYGNEINVMQHVFQLRYDLKVKTHATTNMPLEEIEKRYGSHIYDRAIEMFNFVEINGDSFRR